MMIIFFFFFFISYYCLAALGPKVRKYLWWKRYLTILQMVSLLKKFLGFKLLELLFELLFSLPPRSNSAWRSSTPASRW